MARSNWGTLGLLLGVLLSAAACMGQQGNTNDDAAGTRRKLLRTTAPPGGHCGLKVNARCPSGECCSKYGFCGVTSIHCGTGCQRNWGTCWRIAPRGGACGAAAKARCPSTQCCSKYNFCGVTATHCGRGCQPKWGTCRRAPSKRPVPAKPTSPPGPSLYSGKVSSTYYYDLRSPCPQDPNGYPENHGYPTCTSFTAGPNQQTLAQIGSNNVVAIDAKLLAGNRAKYCGKKVIVTYNGKQVAAPDGGDFFVWDGCHACIGGGRIDFSVSGARNINSDACNLGVIPGVKFSVVNKQVKHFVP